MCNLNFIGFINSKMNSKANNSNNNNSLVQSVSVMCYQVLIRFIFFFSFFFSVVGKIWTRHFHLFKFSQTNRVMMNYRNICVYLLTAQIQVYTRTQNCPDCWNRSHTHRCRALLNTRSHLIYTHTQCSVLTYYLLEKS